MPQHPGKTTGKKKARSSLPRGLNKNTASLMRRVEALEDLSQVARKGSSVRNRGKRVPRSGQIHRSQLLGTNDIELVDGIPVANPLALV